MPPLRLRLDRSLIACDGDCAVWFHFICLKKRNVDVSQWEGKTSSVKFYCLECAPLAGDIRPQNVAQSPVVPPPVPPAPTLSAARLSAAKKPTAKNSAVKPSSAVPFISIDASHVPLKRKRAVSLTVASTSSMTVHSPGPTKAQLYRMAKTGVGVQSRTRGVKC